MPSMKLLNLQIFNSTLHIMCVCFHMSKGIYQTTTYYNLPLYTFSLAIHYDPGKREKEYGKYNQNIEMQYMQCILVFNSPNILWWAPIYYRILTCFLFFLTGLLIHIFTLSLTPAVLRLVALIIGLLFFDMKFL